MTSAHPPITADGPATKADLSISRGRGMDLADGLHGFLVCTSAVLLVTAVLHVILLIRYDSLTSAANAMAIGYTSLVIGGALVALSTVVVLTRTAPRALPTGATSAEDPLPDVPGTATSSGLKVAARVDPKRAIGRPVPSQRLSPSARLAAARRPAGRPAPSNATAPFPAPVQRPAGRPASVQPAPVQPASVQPASARPASVQRPAGQPAPVQPATVQPPVATAPRAVMPKAVAPRSMAALHAPSRPAWYMAPSAAPRSGIPSVRRPRRAPGPSRVPAILPPRPHLPAWQGEAPASPSFVDRLLGRMPQPVPHP